MAIINFEVKRPLEQKIKTAIKDYGFTSKAEFFRFAAINFIMKEKEKLNEEERFEKLSSELSRAVIKKFKNKKIPSLKKQLSDKTNISKKEINNRLEAILAELSFLKN